MTRRLAFSTRRRLVTTFWRLQGRYDRAWGFVFAKILHFAPQKHGFWWVVATFNFSSCHVCYAWRMWGIGFATGAGVVELGRHLW